MNTWPTTPKTEHTMQTYTQRIDNKQLPCKFYIMGICGTTTTTTQASTYRND